MYNEEELPQHVNGLGSLPPLIMTPDLFKLFIEVRKERDRKPLDTPVGEFNDLAEAWRRNGYKGLMGG